MHSKYIKIYNNNKVVKKYTLVRKNHSDVQKLLIQEGFANRNNWFLDLGCGPYTETRFLISKVSLFVGIDQSFSMLNIKSNVKLKALQVNADIKAVLPFASEVFSHTSAFSVLHHVKDLNLLAHEINRVLKVGGKFFLLTSSPEQIKRREFYSYFDGLIEKASARFLDETMLTDVFISAGFKVKRIPLLRGKHVFNQKRLMRIKSGVLDSALWLISDEERSRGLNSLKNAIKRGDKIYHCRDRIVFVMEKQ